jgi:ATP-binding cassette subfamily B protein
VKAPGSSTGPLLDPPALHWFASYYQGRMGRVGIFTVGASFLSLLALPVLWLIKYAFDVVIPAGQVYPLLLIGLGVIGIRFVTSALTLMLRSHVLRTTKEAVTELRSDLLASMYRRSRAFLGESDPALVQTRIVQDSERVDLFSNTLIYGMLPAAFATGVLILVLAYLNWMLLLLAGLLLPLLWWLNKRIGLLIKREVTAFQRSFEGYSRGVLFALRQMDLTRIRGFETEELDRQRDQIENLRSTGHRMAMSFAVHSQVQSTLAGIGGILILVVGGAAVARGSMTLGAFLTFYVAATMLRTRLEALVGGIPTLITGNESLVTLHALATNPDEEPYQGTRKVDPAQGVRLEGVHFSYGREPVLRGVDLTLPGQSSVAIVGPNGAGKSTVLHLILGFYRPSGGSLFAGGVPYEEVDIRHLRRAIGVVPQHPSFFVGTVLENVTYGLPGASMDEVDAVIHLALAEEVLDRLPQGFDTQIGEGGTLLSGGEAQRLAIARALLGRPRLLILDEPTNHLDAESIGLLMSRLTGLPERPTLLIVSHDRDVVGFADQVYRIENGILRLEDPGTAPFVQALEGGSKE